MATTVSPIRLTREVARALTRNHRAAIKEHGLSYAVNIALAQAFGLSPPLTPVEKMSHASRARWRVQKRAAKKSPAKKSASRPKKGA